VTTQPQRKTFWQRCRRGFRWCRVAGWLLLLLLVVSFLWLNQVGLPDFAKNQLLATLRERGLDAEFQRVRLRWFEGIVAENLTLGRAGAARGPQLAIAEARLGLDVGELKKFRFRVASVQVRQGRLEWPLAAASQPPVRFRLDQINTLLRFSSGDRWELEQFSATGHGLKFALSGVVTNASQLRRAQPSPTGTNATARGEQQLRQIIRTLETFQFTATPEIVLRVTGDARPGGGFNAELNCTAPGAATPWGEWRQFSLAGGVSQLPGTNELARADLRLNLAGAKTEWAAGGPGAVHALWTQAATSPARWNLQWDAQFATLHSRWAEADSLKASGHASQTDGEPAQADAELTLEKLKSEFGESPLIQFTAQGSATNRAWDHLDWHCSVARPKTPWGEAASGLLQGRLTPRPTGAAVPTDAGWAAWAGLEPFWLDWELQTEAVRSPKLQVEKILVNGRWRASSLSVQKLRAELYGGSLEAAAALDVVTRRVHATAALDFDAHKIEPLLTVNSQHWLQQYSWRQPPRVSGEVWVTLPAWTNRQPAWRGEVQPTLALLGHVESGPGGFRGVPCDGATVDLSFTNLFWRLPALIVQRPEGRMDISYWCDMPTQDYYWQLRGRLDPRALKPLIEGEKAARALDAFEFTAAPLVDGEIWGRWHEPDRIGVKALVGITNFVFRGEGCSNLNATITLTNQSLKLTDVTIARGEQKLTAPFSEIDLSSGRLYTTNVISTLDPLPAMQVIGPKTRAAIEPYRFAQPPTIQVHGSLAFQETETTDLHFTVAGGPFAWEKFNLPKIAGEIHWVTNTLTLTNVTGPFYGGQIQGGAFFDFSVKDSANFGFDLNVNEMNLNRLIADIANPTNRLEGIVSGSLFVTNANTADWKSWQGWGHVTLRDGLLWELPLFGLFSPVLNALVPGVGNSRAKEAAATYVITNSVIRTDDLKIHSPPVRLHYDGTVDFGMKVEALVEAEMFRDTWLVGRIFSAAFMPLTKILEYKVTGTLTQPKTEPRYLLPKFLLMPFHPIRTLKDWFPENNEGKEPKPPDKPATPEK